MHIVDLMDNRFVDLNATDDQEQAIKTFQQYDRIALPVTDTEGTLIGIVTVDDVLDIVEEETTEDIQKIGGSEALEGSYIHASVRTLVQKRARWLIVLFLGELLTATAMGYFEYEIAQAVVLALFVPLIISSGGNSGSQAATLIIRAFAVGEITLRDWWIIAKREFSVGLSLGILLGLLGVARIVLWGSVFGSYGAHWFLIALTVGLSLMGVVLWGGNYWLDVALYHETIRRRSCRIFNAVCSHTRGRNWTCYLFFPCLAASYGNSVIILVVPSWSELCRRIIDLLNKLPRSYVSASLNRCSYGTTDRFNTVRAGTSFLKEMASVSLPVH